MTDTESVEEVVEAVEPIAEEQVEAVLDQPEVAQEKQVPLSALHKERSRRQEIEQELKWYKENIQHKTAKEPEPDETQYEPVSKKDLNQSLGKSEREIMRAVEEKMWIKANPERAAKVDQELPEFLKNRPHYVSAISESPNRYEEAWELMDRFNPRPQQKIGMRAAPLKKEAPGSVSSMPKAAAMNQAVDVMSMSDSEFSDWRKTQRRK